MGLSTPLIFLLRFALFIIPSLGRSCYNLEGQLIGDDARISPRQPCDAYASTTPCCSRDDFCLSNGLCLDNGGDGRLTIQGCTNPDWAPPCRAEFRDCSSSITSDYIPVWMCRSIGGTIDLCCDSSDAQCCTAALAGKARLFSLPIWGLIRRPGNVLDGGARSTEGSGESALSLADRLTIALSVVFGVLGLAVATLQYRHMVRESKARGHATNLRALLYRQLRLWFPIQSNATIVPSGLGGVAEMPNISEDEPEQALLLTAGETNETLATEEQQSEDNSGTFEME
ncbi:hypothetical protein F4803DRAFT_528916 [Xylaria telfairii]|nr:hypothetical protein F4803DRAFT_528916 [Xylaria telfairii]